MVESVIGTVNGTEVLLTKVDGDRWEVPVPYLEDGEYVVEIMAVDEAGNWSYLSKMLFAVNHAMLCVHVIELPYMAVVEPVGFLADLQESRFTAEIVDLGCERRPMCKN